MCLGCWQFFVGTFGRPGMNGTCFKQSWMEAPRICADALEEFDEFCRSTTKNGNKQGDSAYEADIYREAGGGEFVVRNGRGMVLT